MLQRATSSQAATYLANKAKFNRLRRKSRLDFDTLYQLFSADLTSSEIAKRAALSRPKAYPVDSGSATCCGLNDRIRLLAGKTIDGQRAFVFAISGSVF